MAKLRKWTENEVETLYYFYCPGCKSEHVITSRIHQVSGEMDNPTINPSIGYFNYDPKCHSFIVGGKIRFLNDCTHELAGQTVELPEIKE